ncbi:MAG: AmmeMemoRadiSam system protein B [Candidatus Woesearchaeota archaeon]
MRQPIANKTHYPNGITLLDKKFEELFNHEKGPGALPMKQSSGLSKSKASSGEIKAVITPHASYDLAGPCMAWSYGALAENERPDIYIIVGQAQKGTGEGLSMETFQTPYGEVRVDQEFARALLEKKHIKQDDRLHRNESLIEVQLPFLQYINKPRIEKVKILPLLLRPESDVQELAVDIKETLLDQEKTAKFIFVTNMTSYGRNFHFVPFTEEVQDNISKIDNKLFQPLKNYDEDQFFEQAKEMMVPISGYGGLRLFFKLFQPQVIDLEQYYLSGEINGDFATTVSFASLVLR